MGPHMDFHPREACRGAPVTLRRYRPADSGHVKDAIAASLDSLQDWMPWAQSAPTDASVKGFLEPAIEHFGGDAAANYAITLRDTGQFVGGCGLMPRVGPDALEIGYWVHSGHHRRGIGLAIPGIRSVEIHCDAGNIASASVARRLGFRLERVVPEALDTRAKTGRMMVWISERPV